MISNVTKEAFYHLMKEAVDKGEQDQHLTADELVKELSIRLSEIFKEEQ